MIEVIVVGLLAFIGYQLYLRNRFTEIDRFLEKEAPNLFHKMPKQLREFYSGEWQAGAHLTVMRDVGDTVKEIDKETISNVFRFLDLESREIVRILREEKGATEFEIGFTYWCYWDERRDLSEYEEMANEYPNPDKYEAEVKNQTLRMLFYISPFPD